MRPGSRRVDGRSLIRLATRWLLLPVVALTSVPAFAQSLDISGTWGNAEGCKFAKDGTSENDQFLVLKPDALQSYGSACDFVQVLTAKDGTKVVTGLCESEGEDGVGVAPRHPTPHHPTLRHRGVRGGCGCCCEGAAVRGCPGQGLSRAGRVEELE